MSLRMTEDDARLIADLALGDETISQTIRRVLREAHEREAHERLKPTKAKARQR